MSTPEQRARVEELQTQMKEISTELALPESDGFADELAGLEEQADQAEGEANALDAQLEADRQKLAALRNEVEVAEQRVLSAKAQREVPALSILTTLFGFGAMLYGVGNLIGEPHPLPLEIAVVVAACSAAFGTGFIMKRRLMD